jgi:hypothetical protein
LEGSSGIFNGQSASFCGACHKFCRLGQPNFILLGKILSLDFERQVWDALWTLEKFQLIIWVKVPKKFADKTKGRRMFVIIFEGQKLVI